MIVKERRVSTYRVPTFRDVEDWREPADKRQGSWAVHCLDHDQRTFFPTYSIAKDSAALPASCPVCKAFDQRCTYCPADVEIWASSPHTGFTPSVGHITGNAVCAYHQYGPIPDDIQYEESRDAVDKTLVEVFVALSSERAKAITIAFRNVEQTYCLRAHFPSDYMTREHAASYSRALTFALSVAVSLKARDESDAGVTDHFISSLHFETWEQVAARKAR